MAILERFDPPAFVNDFHVGEDELEEKFRVEWDRRVRYWFGVAQLGDPWTASHDSPRSRFFNPIQSELNDLITPVEPADWTAFPKRLNDFYSNQVPPLSRDDILAIADNGPPAADNWSPGGPRGWQDEYCEWAVERDGNGKIIKVTFTSENPEYWDALWSISPGKVVELYRELLGDNSVTQDDLTALDQNSQPIIDPETGRPTYLRANKFNRNMEQAGDANGVIHLISPPNNLFAEIYLAGSATILRGNQAGPITDRDVLIDCSQFGAPGRNSDPNIGFYVNEKIRSLNIEAALANPVGLYIAGINLQGFTLPDNVPAGAAVDEFWTIVRGDPTGILRAEFKAPPALAQMGITVSDLKIEGESVKFGSQLVERIQIKLSAYGRTTMDPLPPDLPCRTETPSPSPQLFSVFLLFNGNFELVRSPSPNLERGTTHQIAFIGSSNIADNATLDISGSGVSFTIDQIGAIGNSGVAIIGTFTISDSATPGFRDIAIVQGGTTHPAAPGIIHVSAFLATSASQPTEANLTSNATGDLQSVLNSISLDELNVNSYKR